MSVLSPKEVAQSWVEIGVKKVKTSWLKVFLLAAMGGLFIGLGGHGYLVVTQTIGHIDVGLAKLLGAAVFPVGIMLVVFAGGDLYTGNTLIAGACFNRRASILQFVKNLMIVFMGNLVGALVLVFILHYADVYTGTLAEKAMEVAQAKTQLTFVEAFMRGILCNILVAIAVYIQVASDDVIGKIFALWFPVMLFVLSGYEHVVANMFFIPMGAAAGASLDWSLVIFKNAIPVALGNLVGGAGFISVMYGWIYLKEEKQ